MLRRILSISCFISVLFAQPSSTENTNDISVINTIALPNDTVWVPIDISNTDQISGIQFDLNYSTSLSYIDSIITTDRLVDHEIDVDFLEPYLRVLIYSSGLTPITGDSGTVIKLGFSTPETMGSYDLQLIDPILGNSDIENVVTGYNNGTITIVESLAPLLIAFDPVTFNEDDSYSVLNDTLLSHVYDVDTPLDEIVFTLTSDRLNVEAVETGFLVTPPENWHGLDTLSLTSNDGFYYDQIDWPIVVSPVNDAPQFTTIENITLPEDSIYTIDLQDKVSDVDDNLSSLVFQVNSVTEELVASLNQEGHVVTLNPDSNYFGSDHIISFIVTDTSQISDTLTIEVDILPVNDAPQFTGSLPGISFSEDSDTSFVLGSWSSLILDVDDTLSDLEWSFLDGTYITVDQEGDSLELTSLQDWYGSEELMVLISDGFLFDTTALEIYVTPINDAPIISGLSDTIIQEDIELNLSLPEFIQDVDHDYDDLIIEISISSDSVEYQYSDENILKIIPAENYFANDISIVIVATDPSSLSAEHTFLLSIDPVNDAPYFSSTLPSISFNEDESAIIGVSSWSDLVTDVDDIYLDLTWQFNNGTEILIETIDSLIVFTATDNWSGSEIFQVVVTDGALSDTSEIAVMVVPINDPPGQVELLNPDIGEVFTIEPITFSWSNPVDIDSEELQGTIHFSSADFSHSQEIDIDQDFIIIFSSTFPTEQEVEWHLEVSDGELSTSSEIRTFMIELTNEISVPDLLTVGGDTILVGIDVNNTDSIAGIQFDLIYPEVLSFSDTYTISNRFSDHEVNVQQIDNGIRVMIFSSSISSILGTSGQILELAFYAEPVLGEFELEIVNAVLGNQYLENVLTGVDNGILELDSPAPELYPFLPLVFNEDRDTTILMDTIYAHCSDADTPLDEITFSLISNRMTIEEVETGFLIIPPVDWFGLDTITVLSNDGFYYDEIEWHIEVYPVNDAPQLRAVENVTLFEDSTYKVYLEGYATDVDNDLASLAWQIESSSEQLVVNYDNDSYELTLVPESNYFALDLFIDLIVTDTSNLSDSVTIEVDILPVNDPPLFIGTLPGVSFWEDSDTTISTVTWSQFIEDIDNDIDSLEWSFLDGDYLSIEQQGTAINIFPLQDWYGTEETMVLISDGSLFDTTSVQVTVLAVNDPPMPFNIISPDSGTLVSENQVTLLWEYSSDIDDSVLTTSLHFQYDDQEIEIPVNGTEYELNVFQWNLPYDQSIQWWVELTDGKLITTSNQSTLMISGQLYHAGPSWHVNPSGNDISGNGSEVYPYETIQRALDLGMPGDTVLISLGTYDEPLSLSKNMVLIGKSQTFEKPVITGKNQNRIMNIWGDIEILIDNLSFINGYADQGAAIHSINGQLTIVNSIFNNNTALNNGAAIFSEGEELIIKRTLFKNNVSNQGSGGGIHASTVQIDSCDFIANVAGSDGGAVFIANNRSDIIRSVFSGNISQSRGGSIFCDAGANIYNNTIVFSSAPIDPSIGSTSSDSVYVINTILWDNSNQNWDNQYNVKYNFCAIDKDWEGLGNIYQNPNFVNSEQLNYNLISNSPCIDAGNPDLDGDGDEWYLDPDDQDIDGTRLDIGALSYLEPDTIPPTIDGVILDEISYGTDETMTIAWNAMDDRSLKWAKLFFSYDNGSNYAMIDSVPPSLSIYEWMIPDTALTDSGKILVSVSDGADNIAYATSDDFLSISDLTPPEVVINSPNLNTVVLENDSLLVNWTATDNMGLDSIFIFFSTNPSLYEYELVTKLTSLYSEKIIHIPSGVTEVASVKIIAKDIYNNEGVGLSDAFSILDNTVPTVQLNELSDTEIGDLTSITWISDDNTGLANHILYYAVDNTMDAILIDTLDGRSTGFNWLVPNIVSDSARIIIEAYDIVGLNAMDTTEVFSISDGISPEILILSPSITTSIPEYSDLTISWFAEDNIQLDSIEIFYSNNPDHEMDFVTQVHAELGEYFLSIPEGVTDSAQVKLIVSDIYGNESQDLSEYFSVTDFSMPTIAIDNIDNAGIQDTIIISWNANDNTGISSNVIYFSSDSGSTFELIDSLVQDISRHISNSLDDHIVQIENSRTHYEYQWIVPNIVSDQCLFQIKSYDLVQLSVSDTSSLFSIYDDIPPQINIIGPVSGFIIPEYNEITVSWDATDNQEMDSVSVFYTNNGGDEFNFFGSVTDQENEYVFTIPYGVTEIAQIRLVGSDIYGNEGEDTSDNFSVTDNTPPTVSILPNGDVNIFDVLSLNWSSDDNTGIDYQAIYFSSGQGQAFTLVDSVDVNVDSLEWTVPNLVTTDARFMITVTDIVGLTGTDTTEFFSINDGIDPEISFLTVTGPVDGLSIKEYDTVAVNWDASDNIELDSALIWYSNNGGNEYLFIGATSATSSAYDFEIPSGVTDHALVMIQVSDIAQNTTSEVSQLFSITDNTPPTISIISPEMGERFDIDGIMNINWLANDNVSVIGLDLAYSTDQGQSWINIDSEIPNSGNTQWTVVNEPGEDIYLRLMAYDSVGLHATSIVTGIVIDIVYPKVMNIIPTPGSISWQSKQITVGFNQRMLAESLTNESIQFTSNYSDSVLYSFEYVDSTQILHLNLSTGFAGLDTISVTFNGQSIKNHYGYVLDGNNDGDGGDDLTFQYEIGMVADFNADDMINGIDLNVFVSSWNEDEFANELGPYSGTLPNVLLQQDGIFDIEDLMSFVLMGNWYLSNQGLMVSNTMINGPAIKHVVKKDFILIDLPSGTKSYDMQIRHGQDIHLGDISKDNNQIVIMDKNREDGVINVIAENGLNEQISISHTIYSDKTNIHLYVQAYGDEGVIISNLKETIEVVSLPYEYVLSKNYPNPFNPVTQIEYGIPKESHVRLSVFDILGKEVVTLVNGLEEPGYRSVRWNGMDKKGKVVGAGMYFYVIQAENFKKVKKMVLLK